MSPIFEPWPNIIGGNDATPPYWHPSWWAQLYPQPIPTPPAWTTVETTTVRRPNAAFLRRARARVR